MYLTLYPNMDKKNFVSFNDFKNKSIPVNLNNLSSEEDVLAEVNEIRKKARKEGKV